MTDRSHFLHEPEPDDAVRAIFAADEESWGYVMNLTRLWAYQPAAVTDLLGLARRVADQAGLTPRQRLLIVVTSSAARESSYCILAWSAKLGGELSAATTSAIVAGRADVPELSEDELALVRWVRHCVTSPAGTRSDDLAELRRTGWSDAQIFAVTVFAALRLAFATVNDALGAEPDDQLFENASAEMLQSLNAAQAARRA